MNTNTTVAEDVAGNVDVLLEILVRLPAKSLVSFKLVSKEWCSHISDPQFVNSHVRRNPYKSPTGMFLCAMNTTSHGTKFVPFNALDPTYQTIPSLTFLNSVHPFVHYIKIVQSCNGLLLCRVKISQSGQTHHYCVFNPTTKQFSLFPELKPLVSPWWPLGEFLAFDPSISPYYKVIVSMLVSKDHKYISQILVYSSENKRWRAHTYPFRLQSKVGVFMNGTVYWPDADPEPDSVIGFDVITEEIIRMPLSSPKPYLGRETNFCKGTGSGRFFCIDMLDEEAKDFRVLEMCLDESSKTAKWVTKYEASVSLMQSLFPPEKPPCFGRIYHLPVCVVEGAKEEDLAVVLGIPGEIIWYDILHETVNPLCELNESFQFDSVVFQFIESLCAV